MWNGDSARDAGTGLGLAVDGGLCQTGDVGGSAGVMDQRGQVGDDGQRAEQQPRDVIVGIGLD